MPLLPSQIVQPTMGGAITSTTASMLADAGAALSKEIETRNQQSDALMKAPIIARTMGPALTAISKGDFSGFGALSQATALSAGNPFLQAMYKDADAVGAKIASNFMESQAIKSRESMNLADINSREKISAAHDAVALAGQDAANARADARQTTSEDRADQRFQQQLEREDNQLFLQKQADWERDKATMDNNYNKELQKVQNDNAAEIRRSQLDPSYKPQLQQPPPKPEYPPEPKRPEPRQVPSKTDQTMGGTVPGSLSDISPDGGKLPPLFDVAGADKELASRVSPLKPGATPTPQSVPPVSPDGTVGATAPAVPQFKTGTSNAGNTTDNLVNENTLPQEEQHAIAQKLIPKITEQPTADKLVRQIGEIAFEIPAYKETRKFDENVKTSTGGVTFKADKKEPPEKIMADSLATMATDPAFSLMAGGAILRGEKVVIKEERDAKGKPVYQPYAVDAKGQEFAFGMIDANGHSDASRPRPVSKDVYEAYNTFKKESEGDLKGKVGMYIVLDDKAKEAARKKAFEQVLAGASLEQQNKFLQMAKVNPVTKEEVTKEVAKVQEEKNKRREEKNQRDTEGVNRMLRGGGGSFPIFAIPR